MPRKYLGMSDEEIAQGHSSAPVSPDEANYQGLMQYRADKMIQADDARMGKKRVLKGRSREQLADPYFKQKDYSNEDEVQRRLNLRKKGY